MSTQGDANDVVEAPSADGTLVLLVPVIVTLVLLGGAYVIYVAIARPKRAVMQDPTRKKKKRGRHGPRKHPFESRWSKMDTQGSTITAWREPDESSMLLEARGFAGFYNLALMCFAYYMATTMWMNYSRHGNIFGTQGANTAALFIQSPELALAVVCLYAWSFTAFFLQKLIVWGVVGGVMEHVLQHSIQVVMIFAAVVIAIHPVAADWPLSQTLALLIQTMVMFMKMHSYTMTNRELRARRQGKAATAATAATPTNGHDSDKDDSGAASGMESDGGASTDRNSDGDDDGDGGSVASRVRRRHHAVPSTPATPNGAGSGDGGKTSDETGLAYPDNVTLENFTFFTLAPTMCYEPEYPRSSRIRKSYLVEKVLQTVALVTFGHLIVGEHVRPVLANVHELPPIEAVLRLVVPVTLLWLLLFFIVFECVLNAIAEITCFADREFYGDWWNSTTFDQFSRKWNKPVHEWLLRHVYLETMQTHRMKKAGALASTFIFSILLHELVLSALFRMVRPWLMLFSFAQFPLIPIMRTPIFVGKRLGNLVFWWGVITGLPLISVLYAREYCLIHSCA